MIIKRVVVIKPKVDIAGFYLGGAGILHFALFRKVLRSRRGRDRMVVGFKTTYTVEPI
jgi:hypothetical protein